jgi:hypothetical protein
MVSNLFKASGSILIFLTIAVSTSPAAEHKPLPTEPLEQYDNPPAPYPLWASGVSPGMVIQEGPFVSHQVNVNSSGQNITGDAANEPSISVDPTNHNRMVIGWRQFNSVSSNFRQSGYGYTTDGGNTWTFPGVLENNVFRSDPVLDVDTTGHFFYLSLLETFYDNQWRSTDGGQTFTNLGPADGGDKEWFTIDNTNSTGHGFQYQIWSTSGNNYSGRQFTRSTDGGVTWLNPVNIPNTPIWGTPDVDSNGNLFIGGVNPNTGQIWCIRSTNAKNGGVTPSFDQSTAVNIGGDIDSSDTINPGGLVGQVFLVIDRSGTSTNNNIYVMASVQPTGFTTGSDVMFVRSTNGGVSFSAPKRVNDDPINHNKWHWMGTMAVAPNGRIDSVWLDTRNAANNTDSQLFYSSSTDAGNTWAPSVAVSVSFNPFLGYPNQNKMGDYMTIVSDNTGGDVAYAATFNLEEDIYYVRVGGSAGTPTPSPTPTATATATPTATATATATFTPTATATATFTPTATATATATATIPPSPTPSPCTVSTVSLPIAGVTTAVTTFIQPVTTTNINSSDNLVGFQGDFTFDETVVTFQNPPVSGSGLTGNNWNVSGNVLPGSGPIRTLRISAFSNDFTPLSGSGALYNLNMTRVSSTPGTSTALTWAASPNDFIFIDADLNPHSPCNIPPGSITIQATMFNISGTTTYCSNPSIPAVPGVTLTLTGDTSGSTSSDGSGNYTFSSVPSGGNYTITPSKAGFAPGSAGITTVDVVAIQRHFLNIGTPLSGCRLTAADVNNSNTIDTVDVIATQRFFLGLATGIANVGKYQFNPTNRSYSGVGTDQTGQNYDVLVFGDVASPFVY